MPPQQPLSMAPPATSTLPPGSRVAVAPLPAALAIGPVAAQVPVAGSYSSAEGTLAPPAPAPPTTSTFPLASKLAVCPLRAVVIGPVAAQVPVAGSYSSAEAVLSACGVNPPATSTLPLGSKVAVAEARGEVIVPVRAHDPLAAVEAGAAATSMATTKPSRPAIMATERPPRRDARCLVPRSSKVPPGPLATDS